MGELDCQQLTAPSVDPTEARPAACRLPERTSTFASHRFSTGCGELGDGPEVYCYRVRAQQRVEEMAPGTQNDAVVSLRKVIGAEPNGPRGQA